MDTPTPTKTDRDSIPHVAATLRVVKHPWANLVVAFSWRVECPFCSTPRRRRYHTHGAGNVLQTPGKWCLGHRGAHCVTSGPGRNYYLVDDDPATTQATATKARDDLRKAAGGGNPIARKVIEKLQAECDRDAQSEPGAKETV